MSLPSVESLLADLVSIPSVNPMGRALTGPEYLETRITAYLERFFQELGVRFERQQIAPGRENLLAYFDAPDSRRILLFDAHQDTVPTDGMTIDPFDPKVENGRMYGRGSCDVKGGLAAMLLAFARLVRERPPGAASVIMVCTVDEEFTHKGSSKLAEVKPAVDLAVVAEPTNLEIVNAHKGAVRWKIRTKGRACHSSRPQEGVNAIYRMAPVLSALAEFADEVAKQAPDPILGPPSLSVGRIEGGQSVNVVPDWCQIEIDRRLIPKEDAGQISLEVQKYLAQRLGNDAADLEFLPPWVSMPALSPESSEGWVEVLQPALEKALGRSPKVIGVPYGTDAGPLAQVGIPSVVLGPGDISQAHTKDEWIDLEQLRAAVEVYYQVAIALGQGG